MKPETAKINRAAAGSKVFCLLPVKTTRRVIARINIANALDEIPEKRPSSGRTAPAPDRKPIAVFDVAMDPKALSIVLR